MKFTISQETLFKTLTHVQKPISTASTIPDMNCVKISASDNILSFETRDGQKHIKEQINGLIEEEGVVSVDHTLLYEIAKNLPDSGIYFELLGSTLHITCQKSHFTLQTRSPEVFDPFPQITYTQRITLPTKLISELFSRVKSCVASDSSRPILQGVHLYIENNKVQMTATDTFRVAMVETYVETSDLQGSFDLVIPKDTFENVFNVAENLSSIVIGINDASMMFEIGNITYYQSRFNGKFPNMHQFLQVTPNTTLRIDREDLNSLAKRLTCGLATAMILFDINQDHNELSLEVKNDNKFSSHETVTVEIEGQNQQIPFNYGYFKDFYTTLKNKEVVFEVVASNRPGIFRSSGKINELYLLMPAKSIN